MVSTVRTTLGRDRTLALAGVFQAAVLAQRLARQGAAELGPLRSSVRSILVIDAVDTASVFGGAEGVRLGLTLVRDKLGNRVDTDDLEIARYVLALSQLQGRLRRIPQRVAQMRQRLTAIQSHATSLGPDLYAELAAVYTEAISPLKPRIIVHGEQGHLADADIVDQVRTSLLAGIRAAFLWHQLGGRHWQLLFQRSAYVDSASRLLSAVQ